MAVQLGLCGTWSETPKTGFLTTRLKSRFAHLQGYCIDLAEKVHEVSTEKYDYVIDLVGDGNYGKADLDKGCWNGMLGELTADYDCASGEPRKVLGD